MKYFVSFKNNKVECSWERVDNTNHPNYIKSEIFEITEEVYNNLGYANLIDGKVYLEYPVDYYKIQRRKEYPSIQDQLDEIFHNGIDSWKEKIQTIKNKFPKD